MLGQTIRDMTDPNPKVRQEVVAWMVSDDFEAVCHMANAHPYDIRDQLYALYSMPLPLAQKYGRKLREQIVECP